MIFPVGQQRDPRRTDHRGRGRHVLEFVVMTSTSLANSSFQRFDIGSSAQVAIQPPRLHGESGSVPNTAIAARAAPPPIASIRPVWPPR